MSKGSGQYKVVRYMVSKRGTGNKNAIIKITQFVLKTCISMHISVNVFRTTDGPIYSFSLFSYVI